MAVKKAVGPGPLILGGRPVEDGHVPRSNSLIPPAMRSSARGTGSTAPRRKRSRSPLRNRRLVRRTRPSRPHLAAPCPPLAHHADGCPFPALAAFAGPVNIFGMGGQAGPRHDAGSGGRGGRRPAPGRARHRHPCSHPLDTVDTAPAGALQGTRSRHPIHPGRAIPWRHDTLRRRLNRVRPPPSPARRTAPHPTLRNPRQRIPAPGPLDRRNGPLRISRGWPAFAGFVQTPSSRMCHGAQEGRKRHGAPSCGLHRWNLEYT